MDGRMPKSVKVLYVMGLYRSGSTILDIVLSNQKGLVGVGELRNLAIGGWDCNSVCSCGETADSCPMWREVLQAWSSGASASQVQELATLEERYERLRSGPTLIREGLLRRSSSFQRYCDLTQSLFTAISRVSGAEIVVDSSKYPARALALSRANGIDLRLLHLVRDGRAVIWSMMRKLNTDLKGEVLEVPPDRIASHTTRQWLVTNLASDFVAQLAGRKAIRVRYEDLVSDPAGTLGDIGRLTDVDMSGLTARIAAGEVLSVGHTIAGNRVRMSGQIRLKADTEWQAKLPVSDRAAFWRSAGWLARHYGYPK